MRILPQTCTDTSTQVIVREHVWGRVRDAVWFSVQDIDLAAAWLSISDGIRNTVGGILNDLCISLASVRRSE